MEKFDLEYFENYAEERKIINEAKTESLTVEIMNDYANVFKSLSDIFDFMKKNGNIHGDGKVADQLKNVKSKFNTLFNKTVAAQRLSADDELLSHKNVKDGLKDLSTSMLLNAGRITGKDTQIAESEVS